MAPKGRARKFPLEWKTDVIATTDATVTAGEIDLDLTRDEIAEIVLIDQTTVIALTSAAIDAVSAAMYISMDPDATASPATAATYEDLEVFFMHWFDAQSDYAESTETGGWALKTSQGKQLKPPEGSPILVGTNVAQVVIGDATQACTFFTTIYFKRRQATARELNQVILKRR